MSGIPIVVGDIGGPYVNNSGTTSSFPMTSGDPSVLINGSPVLTVANAVTAGGPIVSSSSVTSKTLVNGSPVHLGGSVTNLPGWNGGVLAAAGAAGVLMG